MDQVTGEVHVFLLYFFESRLSSQFSFSTGVSPLLSLLPCIDLVSEADKGLPDEGAIFETHDPTSTEKEPSGRFIHMYAGKLQYTLTLEMAYYYVQMGNTLAD